MVLSLRVLIAPFTLRRKADSTWDGNWIIDRTVTRPIPEILRPYPDEGDTERQARHLFKITRTNKSVAAIMERADKQRFYAWTPLYETYIQHREEVRNGLSESKVTQLVEEVIVKDFKKLPLTGRMRRFIAFVKSIHEEGRKFIIVSDRLFPLALTFYVHPLMVMIKLLGL